MFDTWHWVFMYVLSTAYHVWILENHQANRYRA